MQLAQQYPTKPAFEHESYDPRSNYPSQSYNGQRIGGQQGYGMHSGVAQNSHRVYPDAVYAPYGMAQETAGVPDPRGLYQNPQTYYDQHYQSHYHSHTYQPHYQPHSNLPFNPQPSYSQGSYITQVKPPITNKSTTVKQVKEVIYEQQPLQIPQPVRNIQYIPHLNRYMDYVEERIKIPVEKYYTDYYEIEHVTDFVPREYEESVIEMVPEEIIRYKLEYVPVERKIVHMPKSQLYDQNGLFKGVGNLADRVHIQDATRGIIDQANKQQESQINKALYDNFTQKKGLDQSLVNNIIKDIELESKQPNKPMYQNRPINSPSRTIEQNLSRNIYSQMSQFPNVNSYTQMPQNEILQQQIYRAASKNVPSQKSRSSRRRSNFVTSDGYFPNYQEELRNMESSLNASREKFY